LERLFEFVLEGEREGEDIELADRALRAVKDGAATLGTSPFTCGKARRSLFLRESLIPFGHAGYVALFEVVDKTTVVVAAVKKTPHAGLPFALSRFEVVAVPSDETRHAVDN